MIYCDSSALLKLVFLEPETAELRQWLFARTDSPLTSSELAKVEVLRGCRRVDETVLPGARALLAEHHRIALRVPLRRLGQYRGQGQAHLGSTSFRESPMSFESREHPLSFRTPFAFDRRIFRSL